MKSIRSHRNKFLFISFSVSIASTFHHNLLTVAARLSKLPVPKYPYFMLPVSIKASFTDNHKSSAIEIEPNHDLMPEIDADFVLHDIASQDNIRDQVSVTLDQLIEDHEFEFHNSIHSSSVHERFIDHELTPANNPLIRDVISLSVELSSTTGDHCVRKNAIYTNVKARKKVTTTRIIGFSLWSFITNIL